MRKTISIIGLVIGLVVLGCIVLFIIGTVTGPSTPRPTATPVGPTATPVLLKFTGGGDDVIKWSVSNQGLALFTADHRGSSNFAIEVYGTDGRLVDLVVNEIGSYSGSNAVSIRPGEYTIQVTADGLWSISIEMP